MVYFFDESGVPLRFFAEVIPDLLLKALKEEAANPIYLIELLAAYLAIFLWGGLHPARYVVSYIDNEASRLALIMAYSSTELGNVIVQMFVRLEDSCQWKVWFGMVGSHSNPSDAPSRLQVVFTHEVISTLFQKWKNQKLSNFKLKLFGGSV